MITTAGFITGRLISLTTVAVATCALTILVVGCTRSHESTSAPSKAARSPDATALHPVSLPDLSGATPSVREQIRERYSSLIRKTADASASTADRSNTYGELGKLLMAGQYLNAAEPCYLNAQALAPTDMRWPYYLGHLYRNEGALDTSAAFFERALQLRPDDFATLVWLGDVCIAQGRPEVAEPLLTKARSLDPRSVAVFFGLGRAALAKKDYADAVKDFEEALALDRSAAAIHYPLAMAYRGLGEQVKAQAHLELRQRGNVDIPPADPLMRELDELLENAQAYEIRGVRALDSGDWAGAAVYFRKGTELAPASPSLHHRLGTALFQMGDAHGAVEQFEAALRASPSYAKAHYSLGVILESNGRFTNAVERYSAAVQSDPNYIEPRLRLAGILRRTARLQDSLSQYEQAIRIDPRAAEAAFGYAMALVRLGRFQEARARLSEGVKAYPEQPGFAHALARILAAAPDDRVRDGRRAMTVMQALSDTQRRMDLGETMAMTLAEVGRYEEAAVWQREAIASAKQAGQDQIARLMGENLKLYESRRPCRTPWRDGELP